MDSRRECAVGVDFGTSEVRALVVDARNGEELAVSSYAYPSGTQGVLTDPSDPRVARQSPADYVEGFVGAVRGALAQARMEAGVDADEVKGLGVSATASTPLPVDEQGAPIALRGDRRKDLAAQAWLWKDHTSFAEAEEITDLAKRRGLYLDKCGGSYSSEWYWSKALRCLRASPSVAREAHTWVELCDFVPAYFTGTSHPDQLTRSICGAGHKALFHKDWGGAPAEDFLAELDPELVRFRKSFGDKVKPMDQAVGGLREDYADEIGLLPNSPIAVGGIDAHLGAVGAGVRPGTMVKILGTSSCDIAVEPLEGSSGDYPGTCGVVPESVLPRMLGIEAGQPAVGDLFDWFVSQFCDPSDKPAVFADLTERASRLAPGESGLLALDWNNGNRSVLTDVELSGLLLGQTLHTSRVEVYRALIEASAFGARKIIEQIDAGGARIEEVMVCGGIAEKNDLVMQIYADVTGRTMKTTRTPEACALGAAVYGAVAGGAHPDVASAQAAMTGEGERVFRPRPGARRVYEDLYAMYSRLHDAFGRSGQMAPLGDLMRELGRLRDSVRGAAA